MSGIDHRGAFFDTHGDDDRKVAIAQVHATLALVEATNKQTAVLVLIAAAQQVRLSNSERAEFNKALNS